VAVRSLERDPGDLGIVACRRDTLDRVAADRLERTVVDLRAGDDRDFVVQQVDEAAGDAGLRLAALPQQDDVLLGDDRVLDLRENTLLVAHDPGKELLPLADLVREVLAHLFLYGEWLISSASKLTQGSRFVRHPSSDLPECSPGGLATLRCS